MRRRLRSASWGGDRRGFGRNHQPGGRPRNRRHSRQAAASAGDGAGDDAGRIQGGVLSPPPPQSILPPGALPGRGGAIPAEGIATRAGLPRGVNERKAKAAVALPEFQIGVAASRGVDKFTDRVGEQPPGGDVGSARFHRPHRRRLPAAQVEGRRGCRLQLRGGRPRGDYFRQIVLHRVCRRDDDFQAAVP